MSRPHSTVVTHQRWRAEDLAPHAEVRLDHGLDTSAATDPDVALWCPGAWAAAASAQIFFAETGLYRRDLICVHPPQSAATRTYRERL